MSLSILNFLVLLTALFAGAQEIPTVHDPDLQLSLIAREPQIVTPIGIAADSKNRLFVLESHTHFPAKDYKGAKTDLIKIFQPGTSNPPTVFAQGIRFGMNLTFDSNGDLFFTHRNGLIHFKALSGELIEASRKEIVHLDTPGDYPHNGLGGIALTPEWIYLGLGENLGEKYTLRGSDGSSFAGGGEGGNIFRCKKDGSKLERIATGFWNPFGLTVFRNHLLCVDNDPDSRPPNRLLDVIYGGDYGFEFRYGRNGLHPFTSWNGELPGTLPMIAGTGEAASSIVSSEKLRFPTKYGDKLFGTSWGDHKIELFTLKPRHSSLIGESKSLVVGDQNFRPVGLAAAPDGALYFTDWVDLSYSVHGKGRIWKLSAKQTEPPLPKMGNDSNLLQPLAKSNRALRTLAGSEDPFARSAAANALAKSLSDAKPLLSSTNPLQRVTGLLALFKGSAPREMDLSIVRRALSDSSLEMRQAAVVWIGKNKIQELKDDLAAVLKAGPVNDLLLAAYRATAEIIGAPFAEKAFMGKPGKTWDENVALDILTSREYAGMQNVRSRALMLLSGSDTPKIVQALEHIVCDPQEPLAIRCDAVAALAGNSQRILSSLLKSAPPDLQRELALSLPSPVAATQAVSRENLSKALQSKTGDLESGRRTFFRKTVGCSVCHRIEGIGGSIGPDLSTIGLLSNRSKLIDSILFPSKEVAPQFTAYSVETTDNETYSGFMAAKRKDGAIELRQADGQVLYLQKEQIKNLIPSKLSLMPDNIHETLAAEALADLVSYLEARK